MDLPGIYICSFEFIRRPEGCGLWKTSVGLLVVDEAHAATIGSARAAVDAVAQRSSPSGPLTATPHAGDDEQFRSLCRIGRGEGDRDPVLLFQRSRADVGMKQERRTVFLTIALSTEERRAHRLLEQYTLALCAESRTGSRHATTAAGDRPSEACAVQCVSAFSSCRRVSRCFSPTVRAEHRRTTVAAARRRRGAARRRGAGGASWRGSELADVVRERQWLERSAASAECAARHDSKMERLKRLLSRVKEPVIVFTDIATR